MKLLLMALGLQGQPASSIDDRMTEVLRPYGNCILTTARRWANQRDSAADIVARGASALCRAQEPALRTGLKRLLLEQGMGPDNAENEAAREVNVIRADWIERAIAAVLEARATEPRRP